MSRPAIPDRGQTDLPRRARRDTDYRQVKVPAPLLDAVDREIEHGSLGYRSAAEFVVDAIRRRLEALGIVGGAEKGRGAR